MKRLFFLIVSMFCCAIAAGSLFASCAHEEQADSGTELTPEQKAEMKQRYESLAEAEKRRWDTVESNRDQFLAGRFVDIDFYGRVLDQDGNPAPGVTVTVLLDTFSPDPLTFFSARKDLFVKTDEQGFFEYHGYGEAISVSVHSQEGYERTVGQNRSIFQYGGAPGAVFTKHVPDRNNPVLFRVRKMEAPEAVMTGFYTNDRFPFSRVFHVTGYFDLFEKSAAHEYYDEQAQPAREWKESGFRPQFSVTRKLVLDRADEQIQEVELRFFGGIRFLYSPGEIFRDVYRMAPALNCTGRDRIVFRVARRRAPDGSTAEYSLSVDGKDSVRFSASDEDRKRLDSPNLWVEFPGGYFGRMYLRGLSAFPDRDPEKETAQIGIRLELNTVPGSRVFEAAGREMWERKTSREKAELRQKILDGFVKNTAPFFPEDRSGAPETEKTAF